MDAAIMPSGRVGMACGTIASSAILAAARCAASAVPSAPQEQAPAAGRITRCQNPLSGVQRHLVTGAVTAVAPDPGTLPGKDAGNFPTRPTRCMNAASAL